MKTKCSWAALYLTINLINQRSYNYGQDVNNMLLHANKKLNNNRTARIRNTIVHTRHKSCRFQDKYNILVHIN